MTYKGGIFLINGNIDELIKKYSNALVEMGKIYGGETEPDDTSKKEISTEAETEQPETALSQKDEAPEAESYPEEEETSNVNTDPAVKAPTVIISEGEATDSAEFFAAVFSGEGAYPVKGAKVVVYRGDNIYAFLETDENGTTKKVKLPAFEKENSLEAENPDRSIDYYADVFAEGFISQKALLVSSVGGSEIILRVLMIPESERLG